MRFEKGHVPWNKGKKCPNISKSLKGKTSWKKGKKMGPLSEAHKRKLSESHKGLIPWNSGKKTGPLSEEHKRKISEGNKGKRLTEEHKRKISESHRGMRPSEETRRKMSETRKGRKLSDDHKRKISEAGRGRRHSDETKRKISRARLNQVLPTKDTLIEKLVQYEFDRRGISFVKHVPVCGICQPDIVFPDKMVAVFADGDYWHSKDFDNGRRWLNDRHQDKVLKENGWSVLRFWGSEINTDVSRCVDEVEALLG